MSSDGSCLTKEIRPWDEAISAVYNYKAGRAIVFDGKLSHRTQPFRIAAFSSLAP